MLGQDYDRFVRATWTPNPNEGDHPMDDPTIPERSERGFAFYPDIPTTYGHVLSVAESSAASGPHLWLWMDTAPVTDIDASDGKHGAHMTLEQARALRDQLNAAMANHYQLQL